MLQVHTPVDDSLDVADFTSGTVEGNGAFDVMLKTIHAHLMREYGANRIKGTEFSTVYLGALTVAMQVASEFTLTSKKVSRDLQLQAKQLELLEQQRLNAVAEGLNLAATGLTLAAQKLQIEAQTALLTQQRTNLIDELVTAALSRTRLETEIAVLEHKAASELAQVDGTGVNASSVLGRQMSLYEAQAAGILHDAQQKAAQILTSTWNIQLTTGATGADANADNRLNDEHVGLAVKKMLEGVGITVPV